MRRIRRWGIEDTRRYDNGLSIKLIKRRMFLLFEDNKIIRCVIRGLGITVKYIRICFIILYD